MLESLIKKVDNAKIRAAISSGMQVLVDGHSVIQLSERRALDRRVAHTANVARSRRQSLTFIQPIWTEGVTPDLAFRRITLQPHEQDSGICSLIIEPISAAAGLKGLVGETTLLEAIDDVVIVTEAEPLDGVGPRVLFVNSAFETTTGYRREEIIGKTPRLLQRSDAAPEEREKIRKALAAWSPVAAELINYRKDGSPFRVDLRINPVADEAGWWSHWVSVQRDVTKQRRNAEMAAAAERTRTVELMASGLAHDLNNELTIVATRLVMLSAKWEGDGAQAVLSECRAIMSSLERCRTVTSRFMDLTHPSTDIRRVKNLPAEIEKAIKGLLRDTSVALSFEVFVDGELGPCELDIIRLVLCVENLVINSVHALTHGPQVSDPLVKVSLHFGRVESASQQWLRLTVEDNGPGIPAEIKARLFTPYSTSKSDGTGLGLFMARANMCALGGDLRLLRSSHSGTTFELTMPIRTALSTVIDQNDASTLTGVSLSREFPTLIVEDNEDLANLLVESFELFHIKTNHVTTAAAAIEALKSQPYSVVLTDVNLRGRFETARIIDVALALQPRPSILVMTGGDLELDQDVRAIQAARPEIEILLKPFDVMSFVKRYGAG